MAAKKKLISPFADNDDIDAEIEEENPVVDLDAEEEDDDPAEPAPKTRKEKKAERTWMNKADRDALERKAIEAEARADADRRALQQVTMMASQFARPQQQQADPIDQELERVNHERVALDDLYAARYRDTQNPLTQDELKKFKEQAVALEDRKTGLIVHKVNRQQGIGPQQNAGEQAVRAYLASNYAEASQDRRALAHAGGVQAMEAAAGKDPWSVEVINKAMDSAERAFKLGKHKFGEPHEPDPNLRDRYVGAPRGSTGRGGGGGERKVVMNKEYREMANKAFPHIKDDAKRWAHWAKTTGMGQGDED